MLAQRPGRGLECCISLCKAGLEGDVGFLRKVVRTLAEALMALKEEQR